METYSRPPTGGDVNRGTAFITICAVFGFFSTTTTVIRILVRTLNQQLGGEDLAITFASLLVLIEAVFDGLQYRSGYGRHIFYLSAPQVASTLKWTYMTELFIFPILCLAKMSVCLFVLRIKNTRWLRWCLYSLMAGLIVTTLAGLIILFAECRPIRAYWDSNAGTCWDPAIYNDALWAQVGTFDVSYRS